MLSAYPGELARRRCAKRTQTELMSYQPKRPLAFRDALRIRGMRGRCDTCRACPTVLAALTAMAPPQETLDAAGRILPLAS